MNFFPHLHSFFSYIGYLKNLSYPGLFFVIIASGHIIPIPEPATLIILGYLSGLGRHNIFGLIAVSMLAIMFFDFVLYFLSLEGSRLAEYLTKKVKIHILDKYTNASDGDLLSLMVVSHFVPGWRMANPIIAGITDIPFKKFALFTFISALIYAPVYIGIGYFFRSRILHIVHIFESFSQIALPIVLILSVIVLYIYLTLVKNKKVYNSSTGSL